MGLVDKILRAGEGKAVKQLAKIAQEVNAFENQITSLDDDALRGKTAAFKLRYENGESLDSLLPEAFAVVREAAKRTLGQRHYDVQVMGGAALHRGNIAEMKTGEGKTLVSTLPAYLNALTGKGVHIVTVNDYLAERDSEWMGRVHRFHNFQYEECVIFHQLKILGTDRHLSIEWLLSHLESHQICEPAREIQLELNLVLKVLGRFDK